MVDGNANTHQEAREQDTALGNPEVMVGTWDTEGQESGLAADTRRA